MTQGDLILQTGAWTEADGHHHYFDKGLATGLVKFLSGATGTIIDLGCGQGFYTVILGAVCPNACVIGYDGNPNSNFPRGGPCLVADLTAAPDICNGADWIVCLEVGEHVPAEFEQKLWDHFAHARVGVLLSWAPPGQGGHGHVNCRPPLYVGEKMANLGFIEEDAWELRKASTISYFQTNIRVFKKSS